MNKNEIEILELAKELKELECNNPEGYEYVINLIKSKCSKNDKNEMNETYVIIKEMSREEAYKKYDVYAKAYNAVMDRVEELLEGKLDEETINLMVKLKFTAEEWGAAKISYKMD